MGIGKSTQPFTFNSGSYDILLQSGEVRGRLYIQNTLATSFGGNYPTDTTDFHNIVLGYKGGLMTIHVDGELVAKNGPVSNRVINDSFFPVTIGSQSYPPDPKYLLGIVDDVRIYERGFTDAEIRALFQLGM